MPKFFVKENQINNRIVTIVGEDVNHIKNVLRAKIGENLHVCDSDNSVNYLVEITKLNKEDIVCKTLEEIGDRVESKVKITIYQGLPKSEKMELIIQKSVELGVYEIVPVQMKRCIVKLNDKDKVKKIQRWQKISEVAAKQCEQDFIPEIKNVEKVENICQNIVNYDIVIVAYEKEEDNSLKAELKKLKAKCENDYSITSRLDSKSSIELLKIAIVIGPEGGLEQEEVDKLKENGAEIVTLGKRILRTETVALNMLSIITYEFEV